MTLKSCLIVWGLCDSFSKRPVCRSPRLAALQQLLRSGWGQYLLCSSPPSLCFSIKLQVWFSEAGDATTSPTPELSLLIFQALVFLSTHQNSNNWVCKTFVRHTAAIRKKDSRYRVAIWRAVTADGKKSIFHNSSEFFCDKSGDRLPVTILCDVWPVVSWTVTCKEITNFLLCWKDVTFSLAEHNERDEKCVFCTRQQWRKISYCPHS